MQFNSTSETWKKKSENWVIIVESKAALWNVSLFRNVCHSISCITMIHYFWNQFAVVWTCKLAQDVPHLKMLIILWVVCFAQVNFPHPTTPLCQSSLNKQIHPVFLIFCDQCVHRDWFLLSRQLFLLIKPSITPGKSERHHRQNCFVSSLPENQWQYSCFWNHKICRCTF